MTWASRTATIGVGLLAAHALVALLAPVLAWHSATAFTGTPLEAPSWSHPFGTDQLGRDVLARTLHGGRVALALAVPGAAIGVGVASVVGMVVGLRGGWLDEVVGRVVDAFMALPGVLVLLIVVTGLGSGPLVLAGALAVIYGVPSVRVSRAVTRQLGGRDFVLAAYARGERLPYLLARELAPNLRDALLVELAVRTSFAVMLVSALSFFGLGVDPPTPDWGLMIAENRSLVTVAWWATLGPILGLASLVVALNLSADAVAKALGVDRLEVPPA